MIPVFESWSTTRVRTGSSMQKCSRPPFLHSCEQLATYRDLNTMPRRLASFRQLSKILTSKLHLAWLGRGIRYLGRGMSRIPIGPVIVAVEAAGHVGSHLPIVQGISSTTVTLLQRAQVSVASPGLICPSAQGVLQRVGRNRTECKELAALAGSVASAVVEATGDVREDELDETTRPRLAELEWFVPYQIPCKFTKSNQSSHSLAGAWNRSPEP